MPRKSVDVELSNQYSPQQIKPRHQQPNPTRANTRHRRGPTQANNNRTENAAPTPHPIQATPQKISLAIDTKPKPPLNKFCKVICTTPRQNPLDHFGRWKMLLPINISARANTVLHILKCKSRNISVGRSAQHQHDRY